MAQSPPELILIVTVDSLRWDLLGFAGDETGVTPALDRLAARSHVFSHAYATSSWTKPSITSFLTGSIVSDHLVYLTTLVREPVIKYLKQKVDADYDRLYLRGNVLPPDLPLLHEYLADYWKAAFVENVHLRAELGFARGWDEFTHYSTKKHELGVPGNADRINHDVVELLDTHLGERVAVWIHYFDVHWPYGPVDRYGGMFLGEEYELLPQPYTHEALEELVRGNHQPDELLARTLLPGLYRAGLRAFDDSFGELLQQIEERGLLDSALIVVTSDHGDEFFEHGSFGHGNNLYDTTVRIPLLVKLPNQNSTWRHSTSVSLTDIGSTILELCEKDSEKSFPGQSLLPILRGASEDDRTAIFELVNLELENMKGIVDSRHKLIVEIQGERPDGQIFDLGEDFRPLDMATVGDRARVLRAILQSEVRQWDPRLLLVESIREGNALPEEIENVDEIINQLKAIGYIQSDER